MTNIFGCNIKEPHTHLVAGKSFECEKGQEELESLLSTELKKAIQEFKRVREEQKEQEEQEEQEIKKNKQYCKYCGKEKYCTFTKYYDEETGEKVYSYICLNRGCPGIKMTN